jgi:hypothetical protein
VLGTSSRRASTIPLLLQLFSLISIIIPVRDGKDAGNGFPLDLAMPVRKRKENRRLLARIDAYQRIGMNYRYDLNIDAGWRGIPDSTSRGKT